MGNHYSYTARLSSNQLPGWTWVLPHRWIAVAGAAVIQTAHLGTKTVAAPIMMVTPFSNSNVSEDVSPTEGETAIHIKIVATWLDDGSWAGPASSITGSLFGSPLAHWFVVIETNRPNVYYWAELNNKRKTLEKCSSQDEVKRLGAKGGGNENARNFTVKMSKSCYRSMSSVREWVKNSSSYYNATLHNCQIWAENLYDWI